MANLNITNIPAPRVPFIDERTGLMAREWYRFFLNLFVLTGSGNNPVSLEELQIGPPNQPDLAELLIQINQNIAPQYEDQSGDFLATLDTAQLMSMMSRFENAEAAIQGAYLQPVVQTGTIANYNLDGSPTAGGIAYGTGPALAVSAAGSSGQVLTSAGAGTPTWTTPTTGTVTAVSVVSANGLAGTSSGGATPALTLSTTVTGVVKGNGTALSAATAATDYVAPSAYASANGLTMATARLLGRTTASTGAAEEISVAGGLTLSAGTLTGASGTVTSVTGTPPVVSSGGATPAISMPAATTSVNGYLTSTDWTTFNNKGSGTVTSVAALTLGTTGTDLTSTVANGTTTPVITLQVPTASASNRGALSAADWTTFNGKGSGTVTSVGFTGGIITVANPTTTPAFTIAGTSGGIPYFSSASTWASSAALAAGSLVLGGGAGVTPATTTTGTGVVTALGVNTGTAGAFVVNGGALGTPSSGTVTNLTGTASININGTVGATTANTGAFTTVAASGVVSTTARSMLVQPTTSTNDGSYKVTNAGGTLFVGLDDSTAASFGTAGNYGTVVYRPNGTGFAISRAGTVDLAISSAGAVTIPSTLGVAGKGSFTAGSGAVTLTPASAAASARTNIFWTAKNATSDDRSTYFGSNISLTDGSTELDAQVTLNLMINGTVKTALTSTGLAVTNALSIGNTVAAAVAVASTHKVTMVIGGVTYYLLATNV
ncbi:hypothetical protein UFOVP773_45 [uncultured Caudovirales phage]|uniref:Uncharacterized protein n=1 Tax=uncultured Caudovirales phage TaxID=2100421 RepID=A0A6J5NUT1_9CAUD|nr:hypothetical protein UFOVP773_45 [uncultured Caudovirales phage]